MSPANFHPRHRPADSKEGGSAHRTPSVPKTLVTPPPHLVPHPVPNSNATRCLWCEHHPTLAILNPSSGPIGEALHHQTSSWASRSPWRALARNRSASAAPKRKRTYPRATTTQYASRPLPGPTLRSTAERQLLRLIPLRLRSLLEHRPLLLHSRHVDRLSLQQLFDRQALYARVTRLPPRRLIESGAGRFGSHRIASAGSGPAYSSGLRSERSSPGEAHIYYCGPAGLRSPTGFQRSELAGLSPTAWRPSRLGKLAPSGPTYRLFPADTQQNAQHPLVTSQL